MHKQSKIVFLSPLWLGSSHLGENFNFIHHYITTLLFFSLNCKGVYHVNACLIMFLVFAIL